MSLLLLLLLPPCALLMTSPINRSIAGSELFGSLQSAAFPEAYPPATLQRWALGVPAGFRLSLSFSHFDLEPSYLCEYDRVQVEVDGEVVAVFCGRESTDTEEVPAQRVITSSKNKMSLTFTSDFSNEEKFTGFRAHYSAEDVDECSDGDQLCDHFCHNYIGGYYCSCRYGYRLHTDNRTCTVECGGVFRERSGVFSSVGFPSAYPHSAVCSYRLQAEPGLRLLLSFDPRFDVEDHPETLCPYDHLTVSAAGSVFGPFCGSVSPGVIVTDSNTATVEFHSDHSGENLGWRITYTTQGSQCPVPEVPPHVVLSPVQSEYSFKDYILVTCEPGHRLLQGGQYLDQYQLDCQANGTWSDRLPQCHKTD